MLIDAEIVLSIFRPDWNKCTIYHSHQSSSYSSNTSFEVVTNRSEDLDKWAGISKSNIEVPETTNGQSSNLDQLMSNLEEIYKVSKR